MRAYGVAEKRRSVEVYRYAGGRQRREKKGEKRGRNSEREGDLSITNARRDKSMAAAAVAAAFFPR